MSKLSLTIQDLEVRISADTAIVTYSGVLNVTGHQDARYNVSNAKLTAVDTWHRQSGEWILLEKMVFTVLGAVAELERSLIAERVRAGLRNARARGARLGRPPKIFDTGRISTLRAQGVGWRTIAKELRVGVGTLYRFSSGRSKTPEKVLGTQ